MAEEIDLDHDSADQGLFNSEIDLINTCVTTDEETNMEEAFQDDKIDDHFQSTLNITDIKDEDLYTYLEESDTLINIEWDERLYLTQQNKDRKKKIKEKLLQKHKGKFIVDYKKVWNQHNNTYEHMPTDIIMILKDENNIDDYKSDLINKMKLLDFSPKISIVNGGESINFESIQHTENKSSMFKIPVKLYTRCKKVMVQGTPDCQSFFIKQFRNIQNQKLPKVNNVKQSTTQQQLDVDHKVFNSKGNYGPKTEANLPVSEKEINEIPAAVFPMTKNAVSYTSPLSFTTPTNISSKFLERSGAVLTPSRIAQISQIKDSVISLEDKFVNFKICTENKLAEMVNNQAFQDKLDTVSQSQKTETRILQSKINDLERSYESLVNKVKNLEEQNKQQFRQIGKLEGSVNTLMSLVKDIFKNYTNPEKKQTQEKEILASISNIPTSNKYEILAEKGDKAPNNPVTDMTAVNQAGQSEENIMTLPCQPAKFTRPLFQPLQSSQQTIHSSIVPSQSFTQSSFTYPQHNSSPPLQSYPPYTPHSNQLSPIIYTTIPSHPIPPSNPLGPPQPFQMSTLSCSAQTFKPTYPGHRPKTTSILQETQSHSKLAADIHKVNMDQHNQKENFQINAEIVLIMDSNGKYIDLKLLYPTEKSVTTKKLYCPLTRDLENLIDEFSFTQTPKITVVHCGTNDLDKSEPKAVINSITNSINKLSQRLISSKIIVSGLLPRKDFSNKEIYNINLELLKRFQLLPNVHFVDHSNLLSQDETNLLVDKKHLNDTGVRLFAKNLKISIFGRGSRSSVRPRRMRFPSHQSSEFQLSWFLICRFLLYFFFFF